VSAEAMWSRQRRVCSVQSLSRVEKGIACETSLCCDPKSRGCGRNVSNNMSLHHGAQAAALIPGHPNTRYLHVTTM
jgi:hypothetical protein